MSTLDGNYTQHLANGGCPATKGTMFCQGRAGHYNYLTSQHYARLFSLRYGYEAVQWPGAV